MKVELIKYDPDALELLLFTKQTRLSMNGGLLDEIKSWPYEKKMQELAYMRGTIQSSWEFCGYSFAISGVSRAFTHQLVRTRSGHYAQQSQRTVDMSGFEYIIPDKIRDDAQGDGFLYSSYVETMTDINDGYQDMVKAGANPQDARGVLPTNVSTNIVAAFSLRTLADMAKVRLCTRTQGEYQEVFREMRKRVIDIHPWAESFIRVHCSATGVCCFPNYGSCPIKSSVFNADTGMRWDGDAARLPSTRDEINAIWEKTNFEAVPAAVAEHKPRV